MLNNYLPKLRYNGEDKHAPIPPAERGLQTIWAEPWLEVPNGRYDIEGTYFDREGRLLYCETMLSKLHRVDVDTREDVVLYEDKEGRQMSAAKAHKDGRIFIASVGPIYDGGYVFAYDEKDNSYETIVEGHTYNDLVFDSKGGFYYSHMKGDVGNPIGGVYYVAPDHKTVTPLITNLLCPNGVTLSKDEKVVWVTECTGNRLLRIDLDPNGGPTDIVPFGVHVPYRFIGDGVADSIEIDNDDNLYVAMWNQGRILVFNYYGWPIGQILLPGREEGLHLGSTHCAIRPGTDEIYICAGSTREGENSWIFRARAFAEAYTGGFTFQD